MGQGRAASREAVRELREWESEAGGQGGRAAAGRSLAFYIDTRTATGRCTYVAAQKRQPAESGWQSRQRRQRRQRRPRWQAEPAEPAGEPAKSVGATAVSTGGAESEKPVSPGRLSAAGNWKPAGAPHAAREMSRVIAVSFRSEALKRLKPEVVAPPGAPLGGRHLAACVAHTHARLPAHPRSRTPMPVLTLMPARK